MEFEHLCFLPLLNLIILLLLSPLHSLILIQCGYFYILRPSTFRYEPCIFYWTKHYMETKDSMSTQIEILMLYLKNVIFLLLAINFRIFIKREVHGNLLYQRETELKGPPQSWMGIGMQITKLDTLFGIFLVVRSLVKLAWQMKFLNGPLSLMFQRCWDTYKCLSISLLDVIIMLLVYTKE